MNAMQVINSEAAIWDRLFQPIGKALTAQAASSILRLEFSQEDQDRMRVLAAKAREGALTAAERDELRCYERTGNVLALWKSKARQRLKKTPHANGARK